MQINKLPIAIKVLLAITFMVVVTFAAVMWYLYVQMNGILTQDVLKTQKEELTYYKRSIINRVEDTTHELVFITHNSLFQLSLPDQSSQTYVSLIADQLRSHKIFEQARYIDASGQEQIRIDFDNGSAKISTKKDLSLDPHSEFITLNKNKLPDQVSISQLSYLIKSSNTKVPVFYLSTPVFDKNNIFQGALVLALDATTIFDALRLYDVDDGNVQIIDNSGNILFSASNSFGGIVTNNLTIRDTNPKEAAALLSGNDTGFANASSIISSSSFVLDPTLKNYFLIIKREVPQSVVFAPLNEFVRNYFMVVSLVFTIVLSTLVFVVDHYIRPLRQLISTIDAVTQGKPVPKIKIRSMDEIGKLGFAFNIMIHNLTEYRTLLEEKIQQKTAELQQSLKRLQESALNDEHAKKAMINVLEDIEQSKKKIEEEKVKDEALINSIGDGVLVTDSEGKVILLNGMAEKMLGIDQKNIRGKYLPDVVKLVSEDETEIKTDERPAIQALRATKPVTIYNNSYYFKPSKGPKFATSITVSNVYVNNKVIAIIEVFKDISKEREVDRMKTEFISLASHQLRTPLTAIKWYLEMILNGDLGKITDEQSKFIQNINASNQNMIELVNSLLNISRIESGRIIIEPKPTNLTDLINQVISEVSVKAKEKEQSIVLSICKELPTLMVDARLLRQVYMNILTNAIKYTQKKGEIILFVSMNEKDIITQISDNGYGIPKLEQPKIYDKFFRGSNIIKTVTDGTGLGLYLVRAIIQSTSGKIWFKSEESKGTTFWFTIPRTGMVAKKGEVSIDA